MILFNIFFTILYLLSLFIWGNSIFRWRARPLEHLLKVSLMAVAILIIKGLQQRISLLGGADPLLVNTIKGRSMHGSDTI